MESKRRVATDNYTIGQIGGRLLGDFLTRQAQKFMQRYTQKVQLTDVSEIAFVSGYAGQRARYIMDEMEEIWPYLTPEQALNVITRLDVLVNPPGEK